MKLKSAHIILCASLMMGAAASSITAFAQSQSEAQYSALLQQIADTRLVIAQKRAYLNSQKGQINSLRAQIDAIPALKKSVRPIATNMAAEIEKLINSDLPFLPAERLNRLDDLKADLADANVGESQIYRKAVNIYDIEANYGNSVGSYTGNAPDGLGLKSRLESCKENSKSNACSLSEDLEDAIAAGATFEALAEQGDLHDGNYIHFGRLALLYLHIDSSAGYRYDKESKGWEKLSQSEIIGLRRSVRIARGESAAGVVTAPILVNPAP